MENILIFLKIDGTGLCAKYHFFIYFVVIFLM